MVELKGVLTEGKVESTEEVYLELTRYGGRYEVNVVHPDGSRYSCGTLLSLQVRTGNKLAIYRHSCINPDLGEIFSLDAGGTLKLTGE